MGMEYYNIKEYLDLIYFFEIININFELLNNIYFSKEQSNLLKYLILMLFLYCFYKEYKLGNNKDVDENKKRERMNKLIKQILKKTK